MIGWLGLRREAGLHGAGYWVRPMSLELFTGAALAILYWWEVVGCALVPPFPQILAPVGVLAPARIALETIRHEQFLAHVVLFCFMLVAFWIDIDEMTIPDSATIPGTLLGLAIVTLWPVRAIAGRCRRTLRTADIGLGLADLATGQPTLAGPGLDAVAGLGRGACGLLRMVPRPAPGRWYTRHGYLRAVRIFAARMVRQRTTYGLLARSVLGSGAIAGIWRLGGPHWIGLASGLAGIVVGGGLVWIVRVLATIALRREAMGFGDVTLLAMIGAFLGWQAAVLIFFLAPLAAVFVGLGRLLLRGEKEIPYGPFLCLAAAATVLAWPAVWNFSYIYFTLGWKLIAVLVACLSSIVVLLPPVRWLLLRLRPR